MGQVRTTVRLWHKNEQEKKKKKEVIAYFCQLKDSKKINNNDKEVNMKKYENIAHNTK